jgi:hypothetical protein
MINNFLKGNFPIAWIIIALGVIDSEAASFETNSIEGWKVMVNEKLLTDDKKATEKALELLQVQLKEIVRVAPAPAVERLREVTMWFSPQYTGVGPRAEYHPGLDWLRENGRDEAMVKGVEFTNVRDFEAETKRMPNFTLHELAHAFLDRVLAGGFANREIKVAFERARWAKGVPTGRSGLARCSTRWNISRNRQRPFFRATIFSHSRART